MGFKGLRVQIAVSWYGLLCLCFQVHILLSLVSMLRVTHLWCVAFLFLLLLALLVVYISSRVVVVYWDGKLEDVSKDIFITALENDSIPLIDDDGDKLNAFMRKYLFLSSKEIKLLDRKIAQINLEVSKFKIDLEDI